jgi:serine/threonine protein kinase
MLTGQRPFPEDDLLSLIEMHLEQNIPDPAAVRSDIPEALRQFVLKACARKPDDRYQSIDEVLGVLLPLAEELGLTPDLRTHHKKGLTTLHLIYEEGQRLALKQLLEDFNAKARKIGVELKAADFPEI